MAVLFSAWGYDVLTLELAAAALGVLALVAAVFGSRWTWPALLASIGLYGWLFVQFDLFASALVLAATIPVCLIGAIRWRGGVHMPGALHPVGRLIVAAVVVGAGIWVSHWLQVFGAAETRADAAVTVGAFAAWVLLAAKRVEAWPLWALTGIVGTAHFAVQGLWFSALSAAVLTVVAAGGGHRWSLRRRAAAATSDPVPVPA